MTIYPTLQEIEAPRIARRESTISRVWRETLNENGDWVIFDEQLGKSGSRVGYEISPGRSRARSTSEKSIAAWYAVQVRSNREQTVREELERKSIENYLPTFQEKRHWKDRDKILDIPLFRGYVFARIDKTPESRMDVMKASGTTRIVGVVSEAEIAGVKAMLSVGGKPFRAQNPLLRVGSKCRVRSGSLKGTEGTFLREKGRGRLILSIDLIGQGVSVEMDAADVEVLG